MTLMFLIQIVTFGSAQEGQATDGLAFRNIGGSMSSPTIGVE